MTTMMRVVFLSLSRIRRNSQTFYGKKEGIGGGGEVASKTIPRRKENRPISKKGELISRDRKLEWSTNSDSEYDVNIP